MRVTPATPPPTTGSRFLAVAVLLAAVAGGACGERQLRLPTASELEGLYGESATVSLNGNVVDVRAEQDPDQLRRGGSLWAKVGPYVYLFSPQTREVFDGFGGVAAVRVRTFTPAGTMVAEAMLRRDELTSVTWREAVQKVAWARKQGTEKPSYLVDLVEYGEDHTSYEYNPEYVEEG